MNWPGAPTQRCSPILIFPALCLTLWRTAPNIWLKEVSFPARDRTIELSVTTSRIHNADGELIGALVMFSDLTARKEAQRRLAQTERLATLGELMAGVAHEVRNPLTAIRGYVQIIRQQINLPVHQEYLSVVLKEIDSINKVIQQLLDFSRPRQSQWQQVSINTLIEEALILVQTSGVQARINFNTEFNAALPTIVADRELLKQVLLNMLINAVQAIGARGEIRIRTWRYTTTHLAIAIEDNGCGIDVALRKKLFDPFFTTKASGTRPRAGVKSAHHQCASGRHIRYQYARMRRDLYPYFTD